jgi:hypothetical protein
VKRAILLLMAAVCASAVAQQAKTSGTALTIYNTDLAVARTTVNLNLKPGNNEVTTTNVTSHLEPDSVVLRDPTGRHKVQVVEQNYDAAIVTQNWMLQKYEGKTIDFELGVGAVRGKILRAGENGTQPLIEVDGKMQFQLPGLPVFPASTDGLLLKPTLRWQIFSRTAESFPAELSYLTHGFNWHATYNVVSSSAAAADSGTEPVDVVGWVTMSNKSGTDFANARVKLMAGDVAVVRREYTLGVIGGLGTAQNAMVAPPPSVTQKAFDDFHLYDLHRTVTLKNGETKQVEFVRAADVPMTRKYVYDGAENLPTYWPGSGAWLNEDVGRGGTKKVRIELEFVNSKKNHLGMPLPAGRMRFYRTDSDGQMEFVGESMIDHTPEDGKVKVTTGMAFDVTGERKQTSFHVNSGARTIDESYQITVKNAKEKPVKVEVLEHMFRAANWEITEKSTAFEKKDSSTVVFPITVPAHGQQQVTYTVHYSW